MHLKGRHVSACSSLYTDNLPSIENIFLPFLQALLCCMVSSNVSEEGLSMLTPALVVFCSHKHHHGCKQGPGHFHAAELWEAPLPTAMKH